jgi:hypothetical protein
MAVRNFSRTSGEGCPPCTEGASAANFLRASVRAASTLGFGEVEVFGGILEALDERADAATGGAACAGGGLAHGFFELGELFFGEDGLHLFEAVFAEGHDFFAVWPGGANVLGFFLEVGDGGVYFFRLFVGEAQGCGDVFHALGHKGSAAGTWSAGSAGASACRWFIGSRFCGGLELASEHEFLVFVEECGDLVGGVFHDLGHFLESGAAVAGGCFGCAVGVGLGFGEDVVDFGLRIAGEFEVIDGGLETCEGVGGGSVGSSGAWRGLRSGGGFGFGVVVGAHHQRTAQGEGSD